MGVPGLWKVLEKVGEERSLSELAGRKVAVDLAGYVVKWENEPGAAYLEKLVNLTSVLLLQNIVPVFVMDGPAPDLKLKEMAQRTRGATKERRWLRDKLDLCRDLLHTLGVPHMEADGEAEALCARLDADGLDGGLVDGVLSDDSDAAVYGARTLYRNLNPTETGYTVTRYSMERLRVERGLGVQQLRELALLVGCDFCEGLEGHGIKTARKLVCLLAGRPLLKELFPAKEEGAAEGAEAEEKLGRMPKHCTRCQHPGTAKKHARIDERRCGGCELCSRSEADIGRSKAAGVDCTCDWHREEAVRKARDCASNTPGYKAKAESAEREFTQYSLDWRQPDPGQFTAKAKLLRWTPQQCQKFAETLRDHWQQRPGAGAGDGAASSLQPAQDVASTSQGPRTSKRSREKAEEPPGQNKQKKRN